MANSKLDNLTKEEFEKLLLQSYNYTEFAKKIGYKVNSGTLLKKIKEKISEYNLNTEHFTSVKGIVRNEENIFIENSTANQSTLRRWYLKGNYTPYICSICGLKPFWQGKELTLILDHINGSNHDDKLENLRWVCPNCNMQLDTTNGKNIKRKPKNYCVDCGKEIQPKSIRCRDCNSKQNIIPLNEMTVTREELKDLIRTKSFLQIGKQFNVSDNTIRKWCDKFDLPRKKSEIVEISDDEWLKI